MLKKFGLIFAMAIMVALASAPVLAKEGKGQGNSNKGGAKSSETWTEDNDTNDGGTPNNVADEGDNQHPSGKDRSVEHGNSGNQGKSSSHPDDSKGPMRFEGEQGPDKPNGPGGSDLADQDGNNGCGNDDDFDDDNNGWCGGKPKTDHDAEPPGDDNEPPGDDDEEETPNTPPVTPPGPPSETPPLVLGGGGSLTPLVQVLGVKTVAAPQVAGQTLPLTGFSVEGLLVIALSVLAIGMLIQVQNRRYERA